MRLKIVHQIQENMGREELVMKKESVETGDEMEETQMNPALEDESMKENPTALEASPTTATCPVLVSGKRKRKPKEQLIDEFPLLISSKKKKKNQSFPKSKFVRHRLLFLFFNQRYYYYYFFQFGYTNSMHAFLLVFECQGVWCTSSKALNLSSVNQEMIRLDSELVRLHRGSENKEYMGIKSNTSFMYSFLSSDNFLD